jgi:hypothetical protein
MCLLHKLTPLIPAKAGIQKPQMRAQQIWPWVPAFAGTSGVGWRTGDERKVRKGEP